MTIKQKIVAISNELRVTKDGTNTFAKYDYFKPDDILKALNPLLKEHGLFMSFNLPFNKEKGMYEATLYFEDLADEKQNITYKFDIPLTEVKGASAAQGAGATMTYAKRYSIMNTFSIADNDDDLDSKKPIVDYSPTTVQKAFEKEQKGEIKCEKCGGATKNRKGIKNGKEWEANFCQNKECGAPNFVSKTPYNQYKEEEEKGLEHKISEIKEESLNEIPPEYR
jgi:hypothetical protein